jgi:hypothetical protein
MPTHQAGDLLVMVVYRNSSTAGITPPSGWLLKNIAAGSSNLIGMWQKIAESDSEVSGTWTNAEHLICVVCRSDLDRYCILGVVGNTSGSTNTVNWTGVSTNHMAGASSNTSRGLYAAGCRGNATDIEVAPTGLTNIANTAGGSAGELVVHSSDAAGTTVGGTSYVTTGTITAWRSISVEVFETFIPIGTGGAGGGGGYPRSRIVNGL